MVLNLPIEENQVNHCKALFGSSINRNTGKLRGVSPGERNLKYDQILIA